MGKWIIFFWKKNNQTTFIAPMTLRVFALCQPVPWSGHVFELPSEAAIDFAIDLASVTFHQRVAHCVRFSCKHRPPPPPPPSFSRMRTLTNSLFLLLVFLHPSSRTIWCTFKYNSEIAAFPRRWPPQMLSNPSGPNLPWQARTLQHLTSPEAQFTTALFAVLWIPRGHFFFLLFFLLSFVLVGRTRMTWKRPKFGSINSFASSTQPRKCWATTRP